jgi:hypothetical protein
MPREQKRSQTKIRPSQHKQFWGGYTQEKNNEEAAAVPQKMEYSGRQHGHNIRTETRATAAAPHKNRGTWVANVAVVEGKGKRPQTHATKKTGRKHSQRKHSKQTETPTSERQIPDLAKLFLSAFQINLYFIQLFVFIWQFCGTYWVTAKIRLNGLDWI